MPRPKPAPVPALAITKYEPPPESADLAAAVAREVAIASTADYSRVAELLVACKRMIRQIEEHYARVKRPIADALAEVRRLEGEQLAPYEAYVEAADPQLKAWKRAEYARVEAQRRKDQAEADARAREQRKAEIADLKAVAKQAETPELRRAFQAEARDLAARPVAAAIIEAAPAVPKVAGFTFTRRSAGEVEDLSRFVVAVAAEVLRPSLITNLQVARAASDKPGILAAQTVLAFLDGFGSAPVEALQIQPAWLTQKATELGERLGQIFPGLRHVWREGTQGR